jgi:hypothetical protein
VDGVLYKRNTEGDPVRLICYPPDRAGVDFALPATVTEIGYAAFGYTLNLKKLTLASDVALAEMECFRNASIEEIEGSTYITQLRAYAFRYSQLKHITLSVTSGFGGNLFRYCTNLEWVALPNAATPPEISNYNDQPHDFGGCTALTAVYVPDASVAAYKAHTATVGTITGGWRFVDEMNGGSVIQPISTLH